MALVHNCDSCKKVLVTGQLNMVDGKLETEVVENNNQTRYKFNITGVISGHDGVGGMNDKKADMCQDCLSAKIFGPKTTKR